MCNIVFPSVTHNQNIDKNEKPSIALITKMMEKYLVNRSKLSKYQLKETITKYKISGKKKEAKIKTNHTRSNEFQWETYAPTLIHDSSGGLLRCGICVKAEEFGSHTWLGDKHTNQEMWFKGTNNWKYYSGLQKWRLHDVSDTYIDSVDFLYTRNYHNIMNDIDKHTQRNIEQILKTVILWQ